MHYVAIALTCNNDSAEISMRRIDNVIAFPQLALQDPIPPLTIPLRDELRETVQELRLQRQVSDARFDSIYPKQIQRLSSTHWTPVRVARRAAELLAKDRQARILDVGSGAGKFCLVASLTTDATVVGIEQRGYLVDLCRSLSDYYKIENARFVQGNMKDVNWFSFDGFYLYNPFIENLYDDSIKIDTDLEQSRLLYERYVRIVQSYLHMAPKGTRVATYHGFGGDMPPDYVCKLREPFDSDQLEFWEKE